MEDSMNQFQTDRDYLHRLGELAITSSLNNPSSKSQQHHPPDPNNWNIIPSRPSSSSLMMSHSHQQQGTAPQIKLHQQQSVPVSLMLPHSSLPSNQQLPQQQQPPTSSVACLMMHSASSSSPIYSSNIFTTNNNNNFLVLTGGPNSQSQTQSSIPMMPLSNSNNNNSNMMDNMGPTHTRHQSMPSTSTIMSLPPQMLHSGHQMTPQSYQFQPQPQQQSQQHSHYGPLSHSLSHRPSGFLMDSSRPPSSIPMDQYPPHSMIYSSLMQFNPLVKSHTVMAPVRKDYETYGSLNRRKFSSMSEKHRKTEISRPIDLDARNKTYEDPQQLIGSEAIKKTYQSAILKNDALQEENDNLTKNYNTLWTSHNHLMSKLEMAQKENDVLGNEYSKLMSQNQELMREKGDLQQQCTAAIKQWDSALREFNQGKMQLVKLQQQRDDLTKEIKQVMTLRINATKDLARITEERNATEQEYQMVMSERDMVHKEMERLQESLTDATRKCQQIDEEKRVMMEELTKLKRDLNQVLMDKEKILKENYDLREKYSDYSMFSTSSEDPHPTSPTSNGRSSICRGTSGRNLWSMGSSHSGSIFKSSSHDMLKNSHPLRSASSSNSSVSTTGHQGYKLQTLDMALNELDLMRRQNDKLVKELTESRNEAEINKRRRDWEITEKNKVMLERESVRHLCDSLRKERNQRDRELSKALTDNDEIKRQLVELKKVVETNNLTLEENHQHPQGSASQGGASGPNDPLMHNTCSRDSAIDTDVADELMELSLKDRHAVGMAASSSLHNHHGLPHLTNCHNTSGNRNPLLLISSFSHHNHPSLLSPLLPELPSSLPPPLPLTPTLHPNFPHCEAGSRPPSIAVTDHHYHVHPESNPRIPKLGDVRDITIFKSGEPLGIRIWCDENNSGRGVFVSSVGEKSKAARAGLQIGDQLLDICGLNMRCANSKEASIVLRQSTTSGDELKMRVQYNPDKFEESCPNLSSESFITNSKDPEDLSVGDLSPTHMSPSPSKTPSIFK